VLDVFDRLGAVYRHETLSDAHEQGRLGDLFQDGGTRTAAPTPGLGPGVSLDRLRPGDQLSLSFDTSRLGAVRDLPESATVEMLPEGRTFDAESGEIRVNCLGPNALPDGGDLYVQVRESAYAATRVEVAVAPYGRGWELAAVEEITTPRSKTASAVGGVA